MYTIGEPTMPDAYWFEYPTSELNVLSTSTAEVASTANTNMKTIIRPGINANSGDPVNGVPPSNGNTYSMECGSPLLDFKLFSTDGTD
jgi:hypothetical protein